MNKLAIHLPFLQHGDHLSPHFKIMTKVKILDTYYHFLYEICIRNTKFHRFRPSHIFYILKNHYHLVKSIITIVLGPQPGDKIIKHI